MDDWIRGAWQLTSAGDGYRLDAMAESCRRIKNHYPARQIIRLSFQMGPFDDTSLP